MGLRDKSPLRHHITAGQRAAAGGKERGSEFAAYPRVILETDDGREVEIHAFHTSLRNGLYKVEPPGPVTNSPSGTSERTAGPNGGPRRRPGPSRVEPVTWEVGTPTGGGHLYFRCPPSRPGTAPGRVAPGIDVRGHGGHARRRCPPGGTPPGTRQRWLPCPTGCKSSSPPRHAPCTPTRRNGGPHALNGSRSAPGRWRPRSPPR